MKKPIKTSKPAILAAAIALAKAKGLYLFSRADVAKASGMKDATVSFHFGSMDALRSEVVHHAVEKEILPILADACSGRGSVDALMSKSLKRKVAVYMTR